MGNYVLLLLVLVLVLPSINCYYKKHSPLIDNGVWFYDRLVMKLGMYGLIKADVNPLFHYQHLNYENGVCSSKMGPACSFLQPAMPLQKYPLLKQQAQKAQTLLLAVARRYAPMIQKVTAQQSNLLFLPSQQMRKYDKMLQIQYAL